MRRWCAVLVLVFGKAMAICYLFAVLVMVLGVLAVPPVAAQDAGGACPQELMRFTSGGPDLARSAEALGCRQLPGGAWVTATIGDTRSFRRPTPPDPSLLPQIERGREFLLDLLRAMMADRRLVQEFVYDVDRQTFATSSNTTVLTGEPLNGGPSGRGFYQDAYDRAARSYLLDPANAALAAYAGWTMDRRDSVMLDLTATQTPFSAGALIATYGYQTVPWPWQLADPYTIDSFLLYLLETTGALPTADATTDTGAQDGGSGGRSLVDVALTDSPAAAEDDEESVSVDASPLCANYETQGEAQHAYDSGNPGTFGLDQDIDGIVCEDYFATASGAANEEEETRTDAGCVELAYWLGATAARRETLSAQFFKFGAAGRPQLTREAAVAIADAWHTMDRLAREQEQSSPPAQAVDLNARLAEAFKACAEAFEAHARAADARSEDAWYAAQGLMASANEKMPEVRMFEQLGAECGR